MAESEVAKTSPRLVSATARAWTRRVGARALPYVPAAIASAIVGTICVRGILAAAGHPAAPLDDTFIHLQYARRLSEGGFFSYVAGRGFTTGATSVLWPVLLAPFHAIGFRDVSLLWIAWLLGTMAHAAVAVETARLARPLAGPAAALAAGAMCSVFGAFAWFAWSGMETVPLAWILMRTARVAAARCEPARDHADDEPASRPAPGVAELCVLGVAAPLLRPEGMLASLVAAIAIAFGPARSRRARLLFLIPVAGPLLIPALYLLFAGHAAAATATVKWLVGNPYYDAGTLTRAVLANARLLITNLIDGGDWTAIFLPEGWSVPVLLGLAALVARSAREKLPFHGTFVLVIALGTLLPCTYLSFLWNRVRYIWPFAGAWFVMLACLAREIGELAKVAAGERVPRAVGQVTPLVAGCFVGALATRLPWTVRDLAQSAHAVDLQQVTLARWAAEHLPAGARIGVNDTGAIAYLGGHATFDVVGLTTEGEARYWVAGPGARFEHYEKMPRESLPTHFIVYPQWMACPPVLGTTLTEATVVDQSILGGTTMVAYEASWALLGSGAKPTSLVPAGALLDEVDVADIDSESAHAFEIRGASDTESVAMLAAAPSSAEEGKPIADGGRTHRARDRFTVHAPRGQATRVVMRLSADAPTRVVVRAAAAEIGAVEIPEGDWVERTVDLPPQGGDAVELSVEPEMPAGARFASFHYWVYASP